jgi:hypothetical protein
LLWRAIQRHNGSSADPLDVARVGDPPDLPLGSTDAEILLWAEREGRILVTFDKTTMAVHLANHLQAGRHSPGIFMLRRACQLFLVVAHLALADSASEPWEWQDRIEFIPY